MKASGYSQSISTHNMTTVGDHKESICGVLWYMKRGYETHRGTQACLFNRSQRIRSSSLDPLPCFSNLKLAPVVHVLVVLLKEGIDVKPKVGVDCMGVKARCHSS